MGCGGGCEVLGSVIVSPGTIDPIYTKPMPRGGASALVSLDVTQFASVSVGFIVLVQDRNYSDTAWVTAGTFATITGTGLKTRDISGFKQLVRLMMHWDTGSTHGDYLLLEAVNYSWRMY